MCLYARAGTDLRRPLRAGASARELKHLIQTVWASRADRGAEERLSSERQDTLIPVTALQERRASRNAHAGGMILPWFVVRRSSLVAQD